MKKVVKFLKEVQLEMKKVTWPSKKEAIDYTLIVIILSLITIVFLGGFDFIFRELRDLLIL